MGNRFEDHFTIGAEDESEYPVGGRMLRAHVDEHFFRLDIGLNVQIRLGDVGAGGGGHGKLNFSCGNTFYLG